MCTAPVPLTPPPPLSVVFFVHRPLELIIADTAPNNGIIYAGPLAAPRAHALSHDEFASDATSLPTPSAAIPPPMLPAPTQLTVFSVPRTCAPSFARLPLPEPPHLQLKLKADVPPSVFLPTNVLLSVLCACAFSARLPLPEQKCQPLEPDSKIASPPPLHCKGLTQHSLVDRFAPPPTPL